MTTLEIPPEWRDQIMARNVEALRADLAHTHKRNIDNGALGRAVDRKIRKAERAADKAGDDLYWWSTVRRFVTKLEAAND